MKTDAVGNMQWSAAYGGASSDSAYSLVATPDGGYAIAGCTFSSDYHYDSWLVKTNASGSIVWNQTYAGTGDSFGCSLVSASDGGYAIAGYTWPISGGAESWLVKTDEYGVVPEYSSWLILVVVLTATAFIIVVNRKRGNVRSVSCGSLSVLFHNERYLDD